MNGTEIQISKFIVVWVCPTCVYEFCQSHSSGYTPACGRLAILWIFLYNFVAGFDWGSKNLWTVNGQCNSHWKLPEGPLIQYTKFHTRVSWLSSLTITFLLLLFIHPPVISFQPPSSPIIVIQVDVIQNISPYEQNEQLCFVLPFFDDVSEVSASAAEFLMVWRGLHVRATC